MNETTINKIKNNKSTKVIIIVFLCLLLNIPLQMVNSQMWSRQESETTALESVKKSWGDIVEVNTPYIKVRNDKFFPEVSESNIQINVQQKKRGYFTVPVYLAKVKMKFKFNTQDNLKLSHEKKERDPSRLIMPFKNSGSVVVFKITETNNTVDLSKTVYSDEIIVMPDLVKDKEFFGKEFLIEMEVRGIDKFNLNLLSKNDKVFINSNSSDLKFEGDILPTESTVSKSGIDAKWSFSQMGTLTDNIISVKLIWNNPGYLKFDRIMNYGFLFIALIFITFFILEYIYKNKLHPIQYGAVGIAISIFYLMLLALLEKIGFDWAYMISSLAVISLNTFYMAGVFSKIKTVLIVLLVEILLHVYFYIILSLEDLAFLVGSIGLFAALATFMIITRKFDWYETNGSKND